MLIKKNKVPNYFKKTISYLKKRMEETGKLYISKEELSNFL